LTKRHGAKEKRSSKPVKTVFLIKISIYKYL
jgi:hypothetical protein